MSQMVVNGALINCSFGTGPSSLTVVVPTVMGSNNPTANINDQVPGMNISGFKMCTSPANPAVIAQSGAPATCTPAIAAPWAPGFPTVMVRNMPALDSTSVCNCSVGQGVINVVFAGQATIQYG